MRSITKVFKFEVGNLQYVAEDEVVSSGEAFVVGELARTEDYKKLLLEQVEAPARAAFCEKRRQLCPELAVVEEETAKVEAEIDGVYRSARDANKAKRGRVPLTSEQEERLEKLKARRRELWAEAKPLRAAANKLPELKEASKAFNTEKNSAQKGFRGKCGVHWGTYQRAEEAVKTSVKAQVGEKVRFAGFRGKGGVALHFQNNYVKTVRDLYDGKNTTLKLSRPELRATSKRRYRPCRFAMTVGKPHHGVLHGDVQVHRPLPEDGKVLWAVVQRERIGERMGGKWKFFLLLTVKYDVAERVPTGRCAAVEISYRNFDGSVGEVLHGDGRTETLSLPSVEFPVHVVDKLGRRSLSGTATFVDKFNHETPRSRADQEFDSAVKTLQAVAKESWAPGWLVEEARFAHTWRSHKRLGLLAERWRKERVAGDEVAFAMLVGDKPGPGRWDPPPATWAHIKHLDDWYFCEQARVQNRRRDVYRCWAKKLAEENDVVVMRDLSLRENAQAKDRLDREHPNFRANRQNLALSILREEIAKACSSRGSEFVYCKAEGDLLAVARERLGGVEKPRGARGSQGAGTFEESGGNPNEEDEAA